ncbi:integumentary mucin A.1-like, partial [Anneissia japonica]|uniref:integumentary mucin A.1-like n=1 Tax=Anneissia japonica TaxID=1529436 RepID=UPI001425A554
VEGSFGFSSTVFTNINETGVCIIVGVGEIINLSAMCSNGDVANMTVIPTTVGSCSESDCFEVQFVIGCIQSSTESATTVPDIPLGTRTPEEPNSVTTDSVIPTGPTTATSPGIQNKTTRTPPHVPSTLTTKSMFSTEPAKLSCIDIIACSDDQCNQYISQAI